MSSTVVIHDHSDSGSGLCLYWVLATLQRVTQLRQEEAVPPLNAACQFSSVVVITTTDLTSIIIYVGKMAASHVSLHAAHGAFKTKHFQSRSRYRASEGVLGP